MNHLIAYRSQPHAPGKCATRGDFCKAFTENLSSLHLLAFLLASSHDTAERCFVAGLDECLSSHSVPLERAHSRARRMMIRIALPLMAPHRVPSGTADSAVRGADKDRLSRKSSLGEPFAGVLALKDFERRVCVLSVFEGYSDRNCAVLLNASNQEIREARTSAMLHLAGPQGRQATSPLRLSGQETNRESTPTLRIVAGQSRGNRRNAAGKRRPRC